MMWRLYSDRLFDFVLRNICNFREIFDFVHKW